MFLIDHAWTYQVNYARAQLKAVPGLADRMGSLMGLTSMIYKNCDFETMVKLALRLLP